MKWWQKGLIGAAVVLAVAALVGLAGLASLTIEAAYHSNRVLGWAVGLAWIMGCGFFIGALVEADK